MIRNRDGNLEQSSVAQGRAEPLGTFLLSLDTELAWGYFDLDEERSRLFSPDGSRERTAIRRLLKMFAEYEIPVTWAVVGHLFYDKCESCERCPVRSWQGRYGSFDEVYETDNPLWYGGDFIGELTAAAPPHEVGFHGYTHRLLGDKDLAASEVRLEIDEWRRVAARWGVDAESITFPRNRVGHLDTMHEAGFLAYRGRAALPQISRVPLLGKLLNRLDTTFQIYPPLLHELPENTLGLVNVPASYWMFRMDRRLERSLDRLGMPLLRMRRVRRAVRRAAAEGKVLHVWAHPWEFRTEADFAKLAFVLDEVAAEREAGRMRCMTMGALAHETRGRETAPSIP